MTNKENSFELVANSSFELPPKDGGFCFDYDDEITKITNRSSLTSKNPNISELQEIELMGTLGKFLDNLNEDCAVSNFVSLRRVCEKIITEKRKNKIIDNLKNFYKDFAFKWEYFSYSDYESEDEIYISLALKFYGKKTFIVKTEYCDEDSNIDLNFLSQNTNDFKKEENIIYINNKKKYFPEDFDVIEFFNIFFKSLPDLNNQEKTFGNVIMIKNEKS